MSVEYWLIDTESGNAQGCYLSLDDVLRAAETEADSQPVRALAVLGMTSHERRLPSERTPEAKQRVFVRFDLGLTQNPPQ